MEAEMQKMMLANQDNQILLGLLENINEVLKDTDAMEEKQFVKDFLQKLSRFLRIAVIGSSGVGKSTLLNNLFGGILYAQDEISSTAWIQEYRYGEEEAEFQTDTYSRRYFRQAVGLRGMSVVDTPGLDTINEAAYADKMKEVVRQSDVLIAVFSVRDVKDFAVWDFLEGADSKKAVFVITKCDLVDERKQRECEEKVREYMAEAGIFAPIFCISAEKVPHDGERGGLEALLSHMESNIIGINPTLTKQKENVAELRRLLSALSSSFELRKKQYQADKEILERINVSMDSFFADNVRLVESLKNDLSREIAKEIDAYQNEIIAKLDPRKIQEQFKNYSKEFIEYLNYTHDVYQQRMKKNVDDKTQKAVCVYLAGLKQVFEEATGYFRSRERLISLEDKFYGSIAQSKKAAVRDTEENIQVTQRYYRTLTDASSDLFMKAWGARVEYENKLKFARTVGGIGGAAAGAGAGAAVAAVLGHAAGTIASAVGTAAAGTAAAGGAAAAGTAAVGGVAATGAGAVATAISAVGTVFWPAVGILAGALFFKKVANAYAEAKSLPELEETYRKSVQEFKLEVAGTRDKMTEDILKTIEAIFRRELETADKTFLDFRMSVNIEGRNMPLLEEKMNQVKEFIGRIEELEERCRIR